MHQFQHTHTRVRSCAGLAVLFIEWLLIAVNRDNKTPLTDVDQPLISSYDYCGNIQHSEVRLHQMRDFVIYGIACLLQQRYFAVF